MSGPRLLGLAYRAVFFPGVLQNRVENERAKKKKQANVTGDMREVDSDAETIRRDPILRDIISFN